MLLHSLPSLIGCPVTAALKYPAVALTTSASVIKAKIFCTVPDPVTLSKATLPPLLPDIRAFRNSGWVEGSSLAIPTTLSSKHMIKALSSGLTMDLEKR